MSTDLLTNVGIGLATAATPTNLFYCFLGVLIGTIVGVLPGIGTMAGLSVLFPFTFHLDATAALIMLSGIWYGTIYGGSTASILLNVPGTPSTAVTCLDGYPMAQKGRAGVALFMTTIASYFGATFGIIITIFFSPLIADYALTFGPADYFSLIVMGLIAACAISSGSLLKSLSMVMLGLLCGTAGIDVYTGEGRFVFDILELRDGVSMVALSMGIFGITEVIASIHTKRTGTLNSDLSFKAMLPTGEDLRRAILPMFRGAGIGSFFGILPGTGPTISSFFAYALEVNVSKTPEKFGTGMIEGIAAPEAANNAADQTAFIPTMTLGIPGSPTMAIMLGAMMVQGISPGPLLLTESPDLFWGIVMSFWIGNVFLLILNIPLIGVWVRLLSVPYHLLYPAVVMFICIGVYTLNFTSFQIWLAALFGLVGYGMRLASLPASSLLLGFVLGPMLEEYFRRAIILSRGNLLVFFQRPISCIVLLITFGFLAHRIIKGIRKRRSKPIVAGLSADMAEEDD